MQSKWSDEDAAHYCQEYASVGEDLALRVYTSRLLGRDPSLVLHGGGNTSVKTTINDELGRPLEVLCVKGSGWDMADIEPAGLPACALAPLQDYFELDQLSDEDMVNGCRRALQDTQSPNPSVETLLHAFLPHKFIDHTHSDAVLAIANQENAAALCRAIWGDSMGVVPYIMPGFLLSKKAVEVYRENPNVQGLILVNHGIFTFGDTAREAYERMIEKVTAAEAWLAEKGLQPIEPAQPLEVDEPLAARLLPVLRGCLMNHPQSIGPVTLHTRRSTQIDAWLNHANLADVATRGPITPDHVIRTKQKPMILTANHDPEAFRQQVEGALAAYVADYKQYFETQCREKQVQRKSVHPLPIVFLIRGLGLVTMGTNAKAAHIAADIYEHTIDTILRAENIGSFHPLNQSHLFDMEYWSLEQAKLGKNKPKPMEGRITLVTGASGGIGEAVARYFASMGSNLILTDLKRDALEPLSKQLRRTYGVAVAIQEADITNPEQVADVVCHGSASLGGVDVLVSNAGVAPNGPIHESTALLEKSLAINLLSHQYLASGITHVLLSQKVGGCLLFNASKSAFNPGPGFGPYSIPKAAVIALMKQYAVEFAGDGIRANAINADRIRTNLFDNKLLEARAAARGLSPDDYFKANMLGQEVLADDVAAGFYHLYASTKTTGCVFTVDGGNIAASPR